MKKKLRNNILAGLVIFLMLFSILSTILISYQADKEIITGQLIDQGTVSLTVPGTSSPVTPSPAGPGGGGGGGGPSEEGVPEEFYLDFKIKDTYTIGPVTGDIVYVIFSDSVQYRFDVFSTMPNWIVFEIVGFKYTVKTSEVGYFDLDSDGIDDLKIVYDGVSTTFVSLYVPEEEVLEAPKMTTRKVAQEQILLSPIWTRTGYIILLVVAVIILVILVYQHTKLSGLEKGQKKKLRKMYKSYKEQKETSSRKEGMIDKLNKQKKLLDEAYSGKHISKKAYNAGKDRINVILKRVRKK